MKPSPPFSINWPQGVSQPAIRALEGAGFTHLSQLTTVSKRQLADLHGMGPKALGILEEALAAQNLTFAPDRKQE